MNFYLSAIFFLMTTTVFAKEVVCSYRDPQGVELIAGLEENGSYYSIYPNDPAKKVYALSSNVNCKVPLLDTEDLIWRTRIEKVDYSQDDTFFRYFFDFFDVKERVWVNSGFSSVRYNRFNNFISSTCPGDVMFSNCREIE